MESKNIESYDPWVMRLALIIILIPIICFVLWLLALQYRGILLVPEVQAAVDAQCGIGRFSVDWQEIGGDPGDPFLNWHDREGSASCSRASGALTCSCGQ